MSARGAHDDREAQSEAIHDDLLHLIGRSPDQQEPANSTEYMALGHFIEEHGTVPKWGSADHPWNGPSPKYLTTKNVQRRLQQECNFMAGTWGTHPTPPVF